MCLEKKQAKPKPNQTKPRCRDCNPRQKWDGGGGWGVVIRNPGGNCNPRHGERMGDAEGKKPKTRSQKQ